MLELPIVSWDDYDTMYKSFVTLYKVLNISWAKATHFRRQAVDDAQSNRASAADVSCQTGHANSGNLERFYSRDSPPQVLHALAGFTSDEPYFCARWLVDVNDSDYPLVEGRTDVTNADLARLLIPNYDEYLLQFRGSPVKWASTKRTLCETMPFLCLIFITDQPYRLAKISMHPLNIFFDSVFGERGVEWCHRQLSLSTERMDGQCCIPFEEG